MEECSGEGAVPSVDLREMLLGEERVDLLKMDIEGAEAVVMPTLKCVLKRVCNLFCEYHSWGTERNGTERNVGKYPGNFGRGRFSLSAPSRGGLCGSALRASWLPLAGQYFRGQREPLEACLGLC